MKKIFKTQKGFTLTELLVAVSLFIIVVTISIGALLTIFDANKKSQSAKTVMDNLNLSIENMTRTVRFGRDYHCDSGSGILTSPNNCPGGGTRLAVSFAGDTVVYRLNGTAIQKSDDGGSTYTSITSTDTVIEYLLFYVFGNPASDSVQPYVVAVVKGHVGERATVQTTFSIQTLMSQRTLDL